MCRTLARLPENFKEPQIFQGFFRKAMDDTRAKAATGLGLNINAADRMASGREYRVSKAKPSGTTILLVHVPVEEWVLPRRAGAGSTRRSSRPFTAAERTEACLHLEE